MDYDFIFDNFIEAAKDNLVKDKILLPVLFSLSEDKPIQAIDASPLMDFKEYAADFIAKFATAMQASAIILITEAWQATREPDDPLTVPPSEDPNHQEIIMASLKINDGRTVTKTIVFKRSESGAIEFGEELVMQATPTNQTIVIHRFFDKLFCEPEKVH